MPGRQLDEVWRALSDPTRRRLLDLLRERPRTTGDLCQPFGVSRFAVMKHLAVLESAGLVLVRRAGRVRWNHLNAVPIRQIYERWVSGYAARWATSLTGLKRLAEGAAVLDRDVTEKGGPMNVNADVAPGKPVRVEMEVSIKAPRERVFEALTNDVGQWWAYRAGPGHTSMILEPRVGGRFYEDYGNDQGFLWGTVIHIRRPELLTIADTQYTISKFGGFHSYELVAQGDATLVKFMQCISSDADPDSQACLNDGWGTLLRKYLKAWVEDRKRYDLA